MDIDFWIVKREYDTEGLPFSVEYWTRQGWRFEEHGLKHARKYPSEKMARSQWEKHCKHHWEILKDKVQFVKLSDELKGRF